MTVFDYTKYELKRNPVFVRELRKETKSLYARQKFAKNAVILQLAHDGNEMSDHEIDFLAKHLMEVIIK